jgi:hypothetical protein
MHSIRYEIKHFQSEGRMVDEIKIKKDPNNPNTVILSRWPTEKEKTAKFKKTVDGIQKGTAKRAKTVTEDSDESEE